jgi:hypothetical protein
VVTPKVAAEPDGVHLVVRNETRTDRVLSVVAEGAFGAGQSAPVGTTSVVWPVPPGNATVSCSRLREDPSEPSRATFEIIDQRAVWVDTTLECEGEIASSTADYGLGARGLRGSPAEVVRKALADLVEPGDVVERAGYPGSAETWVRVVRGGDVAVTVTLMNDDAGGWLVETVNRCAES